MNNCIIISLASASYKQVKTSRDCFCTQLDISATKKLEGFPNLCVHT